MISIFDSKSIGARIKELRKKYNETQEELGEIINFSQTAISKIESGDTKKLQIENLVKIAEHYKVTCDYLCCGKGNTLLELLESFVSLRKGNVSDEISSYKYPCFEIDQVFFDYLTSTENAKNALNIPPDIKEQWISKEKEKFHKRTMKEDHTKVSFVPVPVNLIYPDDKKEDWRQKDLIREINNTWFNK